MGSSAVTCPLPQAPNTVGNLFPTQLHARDNAEFPSVIAAKVICPAGKSVVYNAAATHPFQVNMGENCKLEGE
jgi:hypothetical protein